MTFCFQGREEKVPNTKCWYPRVVVYDPIKAGSIDSTDIQPHDNGILRAMHSNYKPSYKALGNPLHTIFVGRLSIDTKEEDLENEFSRYGKMIALRLVKDIVTGVSKRYAFIEYETYKMALNAYARCKSLVIKNSEVFVDFECGRIMPGWKPRRLGGGFGGEKQSGQLRFGGRMRSFRQPLNLVEFRNKNAKEVISSTTYSSTRRPNSNSNDVSPAHSSSTRKPYSSTKNVSMTCSSSSRRPYSSSNDVSTTHSSSTRRPYSSSKNISSPCSSSSKNQYSSSSNTSTARSSSIKKSCSSSNDFSTTRSSSTSIPHSSSNDFSTTHSSSNRRQNSISHNTSTAHSSSTRRPYSSYVSHSPGPSTISLPLTPPSNPSIVLPLTPPSHSSIVLPLTPPSQSIIVLPLTPPSNPTVNLPLTPPLQSSVPLPLTPPLNLDAPPDNSA